MSARDSVSVDPRPVFFLHVMKTAGWSFRRYLLANLEAEEVYPSRDDPPLAYLQIRDLLAAPPDRHERIRAYTGHFPYVATELIPRAVLTVTILRDPVERTISYLKHCRKYHAEHRGMSLEQIYEDPFVFTCFVKNHQTKVFSMTPTDPLESIMDVVEVDMERLAVAKRNLRKVDVLGFADQLDEMPEIMARIQGWRSGSLPSANVGDSGWGLSRFGQRVNELLDGTRQEFGWHAQDRPAHAQDTSPNEPDVSASFRERIAEDNAIDLAFYQYACQLWESRRGAGGS